MSAGTARTAYRLGGVVGRGALAQTPIIDLATYLDLVPVADIHDVVRPFQIRARLRRRAGTDRTQAIWRGVSVPSDAQVAIERWLGAVERDRSGRRRDRVVADLQPVAARDRCIVSAAGSRVDLFDSILGPLGLIEASPLAGPQAGAIGIGTVIRERQEAGGAGLCQQVFRARSATRVVAGGPLSDDVIKCALKPVDPRDYRVTVTGAQLAELRRIFAAGVCDYSRPGVGEVEESMLWPSVGGTKLAKPRELRWNAARSR